MQCLKPGCPLIAHPVCIARHMLAYSQQGKLIPSNGPCPICNTTLNWALLVRRSTGCCLVKKPSKRGNTDANDLSSKDEIHYALEMDSDSCDNEQDVSDDNSIDLSLGVITLTD
mmetsp:Transcript_29662/g.36662  ORF Transcript_29662/g.36662 Transcript_29662/m.36662 type:complete len:114 (-) Transcript_29662:791-1132(-)